MSGRVFDIWPGLRPAVPDDDVVFCSDRDYVVEHLSRRGLPARRLDELDRVAAMTVLFGCDYANLGSSEALHGRFSNGRVLWIPLVSFDPGPVAARYTVDLLLASDLEESAGGNRGWVSLLSRARRVLRIGGPGSMLTFELGPDQIALLTRLEPRVEAGEFVPIAGYFEVDLENACYRAEGTFVAEGLLVARHPELEYDAPELREARALALRVARSGGLLAEIACSRLVSARLRGGEDIAARLIACAGGTGPALTEFAFGTNRLAGQRIDWSINSQLNEGVRGVHFGLGNGMSGAHIDFVMPAAHIEFG